MTTDKQAYADAVARLVQWRKDRELAEKAECAPVHWYMIGLKYDDIYEECLWMTRAYYGV